MTILHISLECQTSCDCILQEEDSVLVLLLADTVDDGVDDDSGPVDDVGDDVERGVLVAFIKLDYN